jgi:hypothetical protein
MIHAPGPNSASQCFKTYQTLKSLFVGETIQAKSRTSLAINAKFAWIFLATRWRVFMPRPFEKTFKRRAFWRVLAPLTFALMILGLTAFAAIGA